jgi:hypothetical protein
VSNGHYFVLVRDQGLVLEIDPLSRAITRVVAAYDGDEPLPNPHDVAIDPAGRLWVTRYNLPSLAIIDAAGAHLTKIDLSALSDGDGIPEMEAVTISDGRAYVSMQRLNRSDGSYDPVDSGLIAVLDASPPHDVIATAPLEGRNPFGSLVTGAYVSSPDLQWIRDPMNQRPPHPLGPSTIDASALRGSRHLDRPAENLRKGFLLLAVGKGDLRSLSATDGLFLFEPAANRADLLVDENTLGGSVTRAVFAGDAEAYVIVAGAGDNNPTSVLQVDPSRGSVVRTILAPASGYYYSSLALSGPYLIVADRTPGAAALRFFDRATGAQVAVMTPQLLPPLDLLTIEGGPSSQEPQPPSDNGLGVTEWPEEWDDDIQQRPSKQRHKK